MWPSGCSSNCTIIYHLLLLTLFHLIVMVSFSNFQNINDNKGETVLRYHRVHESRNQITGFIQKYNVRVAVPSLTLSDVIGDRNLFTIFGKIVLQRA